MGYCYYFYHLYLCNGNYLILYSRSLFCKLWQRQLQSSFLASPNKPVVQILYLVRSLLLLFLIFHSVRGIKNASVGKNSRQNEVSCLTFNGLGLV